MVKLIYLELLCILNLINKIVYGFYIVHPYVYKVNHKNKYKNINKFGVIQI